MPPADDESEEAHEAANEEHFPVVLPCLAFYTEQRANANGKGTQGFLKHPVIHFWTGSEQMNQKLAKALKGNKTKRAYHTTYEKLKQAVFGDGSINEPQVNKTLRRTATRKQKEMEEESDSGSETGLL